MGAQHLIDLVRVRGKQNAVMVYELHVPSSVDDGEKWFRDEFSEALEAYRSREWQEAYRKFTSLASRAPEDGPTNRSTVSPANR